MANPSTCFSLAGSKSCPMFANYRIQPYANVFANVQQFDQYIASSFPNSTTYQNYFRQTFSCPNWDGTGLQYTTSFICGLIVDISTSQFNCNQGVQVMNICKSTAATTLNSYNRIFSNPRYCTQGASRALPTYYNTFGQRLSADSPPTNCIAGLSSEVANCGFATMNEAHAYCQTTANDPCCKTMMGSMNQPTSSAGNSPILSTTSSIPSKSNPNTSSTASANDTTGSTEASQNNTLIIGAAVGGVLLVAAIVGLIYWLMKRNKSSDTSREGDQLNVAETMQVVYDYSPNLFDEIHLYVGDKVLVKCKFDDGWAYGVNLTTKKEGSFPLACVESLGGSSFGKTDAAAIKQRASSLYISNNRS